MSSSPKKKEETNVSGIFSIPANPFEDGAIPGVTQLLSRNQLIEKEKKVTPPPSKPAAPFSLKNLGVLFELRFAREGEHFRYTHSKGHKEIKLLPWQEQIFQKAKLDSKTTSSNGVFQEYSSSQNTFLFEAFGVQPQHYVQIVTPPHSNEKILLVSDQSIASHQEAIIDYCSKP